MVVVRQHLGELMDLILGASPDGGEGNTARGLSLRVVGVCGSPRTKTNGVPEPFGRAPGDGGALGRGVRLGVPMPVLRLGGRVRCRVVCKVLTVRVWRCDGAETWGRSFFPQNGGQVRSPALRRALSCAEAAVRRSEGRGHPWPLPT